MCYRYLCLIFVGCLTFVVSTPADVIWSGSQYQRAYHDLSSLDINQDGANDFTFNEVFTDHPFGPFWEVFVEPADGQILIENDGGISAISLSIGTAITGSQENPNHVWTNGNAFLFGYDFPEGKTPSYGGYFIDKNAFLGISFNISGSTHYGWIQMSHDRTRPDPLNNSLMIHGWAWETEADTPIIAGAIPEPSSGILTMIGTLALLQLARHRRRKQTHPSIPRYRYPKTPEEPEEW